MSRQSHDIFDTDSWKCFPHIEADLVRMQQRVNGKATPARKHDHGQIQEQIEKIREHQTEIFQQMIEPMEQEFKLDHKGGDYTSFVNEFDKQREQTINVMELMGSLVTKLQDINRDTISKRAY